MQTVRKAIIPVAGFGTRLYPATHGLKKDFFPIPDKDGLVKPVILILLEELVASGIEEVCLVLGSEEERQKYREYFETPLPEDHMGKMKPELQAYAQHILDIGKRLRYVYQIEKRGFGHAVYQAVDFTKGEPVLLLLGDTLYRSDTDKPCVRQFIEKYDSYKKLMVSIHPIPLNDVTHYGILTGTWMDQEETVLNITQMTEKPSVSYAEQSLGVACSGGGRKYMSVFGQYILTPEVFEQLRLDIEALEGNSKEVELTSALDKVREKSGMVGVRLQGRMFDMGNYQAFVNCVTEFSKQ